MSELPQNYIEHQFEIAETIVREKDIIESLPGLLRPWDTLIDETTDEKLKARRDEVSALVAPIVGPLNHSGLIDSENHPYAKQNNDTWKRFCDHWREISVATGQGDLDLGDRLLYYPIDTRFFTEEPFKTKIQSLGLLEKMNSALEKMREYTKELSTAVEIAYAEQQKDIRVIAEKLKPIVETVNSLDEGSEVSFHLRHFYNNGNLRFALRQYNRSIVSAGRKMKNTASEEEIGRMANTKEEPKPERGIATAHELRLIVQEILETASKAKNTYSKVLPANEPPATPTDVVQETRNGGMKNAVRKLLSLSV